MIGADSIGFMPVACLDKLANGAGCGFCKGCFTGDYPVDPDGAVLKNKFETYLPEVTG